MLHICGIIFRRLHDCSRDRSEHIPFQEIAASVLSVISFPAFAVQDEELVNQARKEIISKLEVIISLFQSYKTSYITCTYD